MQASLLKEEEMIRSYRTAALLLAASLLGGSPFVVCQPRGTSAAPEGSAPRLDDLAWLAGHWRGQGFGGIVEEVWTPPLAGSMLGLFRHIKDGKLVFQEIVMLAEEDGALVMKVKHFTPEFVAWESKEDSVRFPLERLGEREAFFNGLTLQSPDEGTLIIKIRIRYKEEGVTREETLSFQRYSAEGN